VYFIEVKFHQFSHGRLGFGSRSGAGFQPEIVTRKPVYFETNLRWILASEGHTQKGVLFVPSETIRKYLSGGVVGEKFNNIRARIFDEIPSLSETELIEALGAWLGLSALNRALGNT
jgi:hypothetical protein